MSQNQWIYIFSLKFLAGEDIEVAHTHRCHGVFNNVHVAYVMFASGSLHLCPHSLFLFDENVQNSFF
jgi:hypothetical protein